MFKLDDDVGFHVEYESFSFDPTIPDLVFKLDDNIPSLEYESFSREFAIHGSSDDGLCANYVSFSFDPIQTDFLFKCYESEFVESKIIATKNFALDQTLVLFDMTRLVNLAPTLLPRLFVHADTVSRPMTSILALSEYVHFLFDWVQLFDKLKRALTCALLARWMYSF